MLYNGCGLEWSAIGQNYWDRVLDCGRDRLDVGVAAGVAWPLTSTSPPGHHLLLPADAHADSAAACELPDAV